MIGRFHSTTYPLHPARTIIKIRFCSGDVLRLFKTKIHRVSQRAIHNTIHPLYIHIVTHPVDQRAVRGGVSRSDGVESVGDSAALYWVAESEMFQIVPRDKHHTNIA